MTEVNKYGLSRYIPADVRRLVRQRCKFGCVICRRGFYQYEHIDPPFADAKTHDPDRICCLCASCHDSVTRGHSSKSLATSAYSKIQAQQPSEAEPPIGPLDFHEGNAELAFGGITDNRMVQSVLRYHGREVFRVVPGVTGGPGSISAIFTDYLGEEVMRLDDNEWVGDLGNWDIEITGARIRVRRRQGETNLTLRLAPPGRVVVEHLDMRIGTGHLLATERTYVAGRHLPNGLVQWFHADVLVQGTTPQSALIEFAEPAFMESRDLMLKGQGTEMSTPGRGLVIGSFPGVMMKECGIAVASFCPGLLVGGIFFGQNSLEKMRGIINGPDEMNPFLLARWQRRV